MIGSRNIVSLFWILSAKSVLGNDNAVGAVDHDGTGRSLRASVGGNLFGGLFAKKMCRKTGDGVFDTISSSRFRFRANSSPGDMTGACSGMCKDLCPTSCYGSFKVDGGKCTCDALKCSGNAVCSSSKKCECRAGFNGNGLVCCDTSSGLNFTEAGCVARPLAPTPMAPLAPVAALPSPAATLPSPGVTPITPINPVAPAPRAPTVGGRTDLVPPKLVDFRALSNTAIDVSSGTAKIDFSATMYDVKSGVKNITVYAQSFPRNVLYNKTFDPPAVGTSVHTFSMPFSKYLFGGIYGLIVIIFDAAEQYKAYTMQDLAELEAAYDIEVISTYKDTAPPQLLSIEPLTPLLVNRSIPNQKIVFRVTAQDDVLLGPVNGFFGASDLQGYGNFYNEERFAQYGVDSSEFPFPGTHSTNMTIEVQSWMNVGSYPLNRIVLYDFERGIAYTGANLTFSSVITIVR